MFVHAIYEATLLEDKAVWQQSKLNLWTFSINAYKNVNF